MNICFLTKDYFPNIKGGVGSYVYEISHALTKLGHRIFVITSVESPDYDCKIDNDEGIMVFRVKPVSLSFLNLFRERIPGLVERLEYSFAVSKKLKEIHRKYHIDIVEGYEARAEGFWFYLFRRSPPLVIKLHTPEGIIFKWNGTPDSLDIKLITKLEEFWLMRAKKIVGITKSIVELAKILYGFNSISVIHNPLDITKFKNVSAYELSNEINILYVGRLEFRKGVHVLIKAIPKVLEKIPTAKFTFIGDDCGMKWFLENKINEFGCREQVNLIPHISRDKLIDYYLQATICVIPSLWENFPYTCLEPMALGKVVVAANAGGIREIIEDGINGILFTPGSYQDLANKIISVCLDIQLRKKIESNARKRIELLCNPEKIAKETINIYESCLNNDKAH